jgi:hypothetical protein
MIFYKPIVAITFVSALLLDLLDMTLETRALNNPDGIQGWKSLSLLTSAATGGKVFQPSLSPPHPI